MNLHPRQGIRNIPEICFRHGLTKVVICPGSRNAPLILSFTKHPSLDCLSITDERSAGYFALGMSQLNGGPVAVVCTSGTAVLNLAPSVAEAFYQNLPLVVITADRPKEWIDQADGQTIRQAEIFRNYVKQSFDLPLETSHPDDLWYFNRSVSQAIDTALKFPAGPVHINVPLREPLYTPLPETFELPNITRTAVFQPDLSVSCLNDYLEKWNRYEKKMIIFGMQRKDENLNRLAGELARRSDVVVIAENISNLSGGDIIYAPEPLVASFTEEEKQLFRPELIVTVGEGIVSKRLKQYLRMYAPAEQWHLGTSAHYTDTFKSLSSLIHVEPFSFLGKLNGESQGNPSGYQRLKLKNKELAKQHAGYASTAGMTDLNVIHRILNAIPEKAIVHLANSTPVRYAQLSATREALTYFSNRGTSGIDGCISTAAGSAYLSGKQVFVLSGDLAFIYDSHALWNNFIHNHLKIVVINNHGGNIFSLIDTGPEMERARPYFETPHRVKIKALAEAYGASYLECSDLNDLDERMEELSHIAGTCILEITTDARVNTRVFKEYYQSIKSMI